MNIGLISLISHRRFAQYRSEEDTEITEALLALRREKGFAQYRSEEDTEIWVSQWKPLAAQTFCSIPIRRGY